MVRMPCPGFSGVNARVREQINKNQKSLRCLPAERANLPATIKTLNIEHDHDTSIMLRLKSGEETALNELMSRWQSQLVSFIYRYVGDEGDALDLAQETFVRVFRSTAHGYKGKAKFSTPALQHSRQSLSHLRFVGGVRHPTVSLTHEEDHERGDNAIESLPSA